MGWVGVGVGNFQLRFRLRLASFSSSWPLRYHEADVSELDVCSAVANRWLSWAGEWVVVEWLRIVRLLASAFELDKDEPSVDATCEGATGLSGPLTR
jgi:hypothetical protein